MLSLASCRPLMPLSLQEGLLAPGAALPAGLLTFSSLPTSPAVSLSPGTALFSPTPRPVFALSPPSLPWVSGSFIFLLPSNLLCLPPFHLPSVFLGSVPHCFPILTGFGPPWLLALLSLQSPSSDSVRKLGPASPFPGSGSAGARAPRPALDTYLLQTSVLPLAHLFSPRPPVFFSDLGPVRPPPQSLRIVPAPRPGLQGWRGAQGRQPL